MSSKRVIDVLISSLILLVSAPLLVLLSVLAILDSGLPVFLGQERVGRISRASGF